ncbi:MAG: hypothetical protein ACKOX6_08660 [Bdellovibrio sp.]
MEQTEVKKNLLIIKSHPHSLGPVEGFLLNREWKIKSTSNLKEALAYLVQNQPQFVMISIDHPNKKVRNLPKVLSQALPVCVIAFAESSTSASIKNLSDCASGYAIFHPVTGPAVERMVNKYYKDLQTNPSAFSSRGEWNQDGKNASGMIAIKGEGGLGTSEAAQNFLASLMAIDGGTMATGNTSGMMHSQSEGVGSTEMASAQSASGTNHTSTQDSSSETSMNSLSPQGSSSMDPSSAHGTSSSNPLSPDYQGPAITDSLSGELTSAKARKTDGGWAPLEVHKKTPQHRYSNDDEKNSSLKTEDSLIFKGVRDAMEKACIQFPDPQVVEMEQASHVACILVESSRFSGYLVAATAKDQIIDRAFVEKIRSRLFRFLRDNGEKIEDNESMPIKLKQVPFMTWALECADFLRKSIHEGHEVALAFFPRPNLRAEIIDSADSEMAAVNIQELVADAVVEFNVYIHLPRNNRYVLYTPCGGIFFNAQKERLVSQGVSHLHVLRMELSGLDKYRAQNFLNNTIEEFEAKAPDKVTA